MPPPPFPTTSKAAAPATGDGLCVLSTAIEDNDHVFVYDIL